MSESDDPVLVTPLRKLHHDINNHLAVLTMGLDVLPKLDPADREGLREMCEMMRSEGVDPLKDLIQQVCEYTLESES